MYLGDFNFGSTVFFKFTTVNSSGVPTALSSAGVTVYRDGSTVQDTTGITLTASFDTITGLNHVVIGLSTVGFYSSAGEYMAIISSGAASENLAGYTLAHFSVRRLTPFSTAGLETLSTVGIETLSTAGLETLSTVGIETLSTVGIETLSTVGLETLSTIGLETASSLVDMVNMTTAAAIQVNAEVVDALATDTYGEPTAGPPPATPSIAEMLRFQHFTLRHQIRVNSSNKTFFNSSGNTLWTKGLLGDSATYIELLGTTST